MEKLLILCILAVWSSFDLVKANQPNGLKSVSTGGFGTWATDSEDGIWYLTDSGDWQRTSGALKQLSVGANSVWGVAHNDQIYFSQTKAPNARWQRVDGGLMHVSVSEDGRNIWGVSSNQQIWKRTLTGWKRIEGQLVQISVGPSGVWGVTEAGGIFFRTGTHIDRDSLGSGWEKIDGSLVRVTSGPGYIYGVNKANMAYIRYTSASNPTGGSWHQLQQKYFEL